MKKIGMVCDNYKVERFEKEFKDRGLQWSKFQFNKDAVLLKVYTTQETAATIAQAVEDHFNKLKAKGN